MRKTVFLLLLSFLLISFSSSAQRWKRIRFEHVFGLGASNFLGDLGGANQIGTNFAKDLELNATRLAMNYGLRYQFTEYIAFKSSLTYARIKGDDKLTQEYSRNNRNLSFRSPVVELAFHIEPAFIRERAGHKYKLEGIKGKKGFAINAYPFIGIAMFYFNPRAEYGGKWHSLQPLSTEGQGFFMTRKKYSRFQIAIPYGIGAKYGYKQNWSFGFEFGMRKTFTDYLDDVSTTYIDNDYIRLQKGDIAAALADRSDGSVPEKTLAGQQRGDPSDKDSYFFLIFSLNLKFAWGEGKGSRPKF